MKCKDIAKYISQELVNKGFIVHRYDSYSTCSIYLKLDYGACNSIRISDHSGYEHLSYKYNINQKVYKDGWYKDKNNKWRYSCRCNKESIDKLITIIVNDKFNKLSTHNYKELLEYYKLKSNNSKISFWKDAKEVKLDESARITETNN